MRHNKSGRKLNRNPAHRKALFRNMTRALLVYGRIRSTEAKAMELRRVVEPLITMAKKNDLHARREAYKFLNSHQLVQKLFDVIAPLFAGVPGGYTRVVKLGIPRKGDAAPMAVIEFTKEIDASAGSEPEKAAKETKAAESPKKAPAKKAASKKPAEPKADSEKKPAAKKAESKAEAAE